MEDVKKYICTLHVFTCSEKAFYLQILLDPFEKEFNLPLLFVKFCDLGYCKTEVVSNKLINFLKQSLKNIWITTVHCFGKRGFCHCFHAEMIKTFVVGKQSSFNFTQRILTGNLSKQQSQKLFPCGKMFTVSVTSGFFYVFFQNDIGG